MGIRLKLSDRLGRVRLKPSRCPRDRLDGSLALDLRSQNEKSPITPYERSGSGNLGHSEPELLVVAEAHHDVVQLFMHDEVAMMPQFVLVDRFSQLLRIRIQQAVCIAELTTLTPLRMTIFGLTTIHERDRLLLE